MSKARALLSPSDPEVMLEEPQLSIISCPGDSSSARDEEEEEKEEGLVLVLLGHHKPEARPCTHQALSVPLQISHVGPSSARGTMFSLPGHWRWVMPAPA